MGIHARDLLQGLAGERRPEQVQTARGKRQQLQMAALGIRYICLHPHGSCCSIWQTGTKDCVALRKPVWKEKKIRRKKKKENEKKCTNRIDCELFLNKNWLGIILIILRAPKTVSGGCQ